KKKEPIATPFLENPPIAQGDGKALKLMGAPGQAAEAKLHQVAFTGGDTTQEKIEALGQLYDNAIADPNRKSIFRSRMEAIAKIDPKLFDDMTQIGKDIAANKSPQDIGKEIATALQGSFDRQSAKSKGGLDLTTDSFMTVMGGLSGLMIARHTTGQATVDMVNAAEQELSRVNRRTGIAAENGAPMEIHPVRW